ncbi:acetyl/propionyl/methylcrotonyl-CoA carboxylase subunit alpha [Sphingomonas sp. NSE70-1]|uniref:Acetyl/propionyl/methylcrotonyl-CoA carboxylase subunit alpha n=1 Tax=Sphingomonas caseinilyticus TaxID=2908205 RepID=A0ABT0RST7_9SPHN|nr:acetyl/propionyl/methylcrotonyl-CoA carboxylase subunit alpha [Sphingomonas caseinilyticus]MCL6698064.1 acetyl/propionyl/methylcrotonyl-CoA carboxylase subunit alpha [Sphingomonas caseinilyticus]
MIKSLLIANRGEIACRIIRTARKLGIRTVAVYSDADAKALHVRMADEAVHIGPSAARESYLVGEKIIAAAKATKAQAIHPGYGFLSENADFAEAVIKAGLTWVGPKPDSIRAMGLKDAAKKLMADAGVPVTPGYLGEDQSPKRLQNEADAIGYPVLIKAVAGGGGKGMRKVDAAKDFEDALESCKREAASSFGDDRVLIEKYILSPRHIEVQVFGDSHGNVVHLFERDCSLQRRHQKVIEEAPAPGMDEATRQAVCGAAVRAAKAVNYEGAGTIEFIADASKGLKADRIWFMEMNTRLQVEHPVTEEITGQDLVEWQLRVASGERLPLTQDELSINGWAIEARLYAEDPAKGFLPSVGRLEHFDLGDEGRIETGVEEGDAISPFYDPMIAKLVARGDDRADAIAELAGILDEVEVWPVKTNAGFLFSALLDEDFGRARLDTGFIERKLDELVPDPEPDEAIWRGAAAVATAEDEEESLGDLTGFRLNSSPSLGVALGRGGKFQRVELEDGEPLAAVSGFRDEERVVVFYEGQAYEFDRSSRGTVGAAAGDGAIIAPMPGKVTSVEVSKGDKVSKGQRLLTLEAMKMEHGLTAPFDGVVAELNAKAGAQVQVDAVLAKVEKEKPSS